MAILRVVSRGMDRDTYQTMREMLDIDHKHPLGLIMHGATEVDGAIVVAQIWDSHEYARRFDEELLQPALEAAKVAARADVTVFELEHLVTP